MKLSAKEILYKRAERKDREKKGKFSQKLTLSWLSGSVCPRSGAVQPLAPPFESVYAYHHRARSLTSMRCVPSAPLGLDELGCIGHRERR